MTKRKLIVFFLLAVLVFVGLSVYLIFKSFSPIFAAPASYNPTFEVVVTNRDTGVNSDIYITVDNPAGSKINKTIIFTIPSGWQIAQGTSVSDNLKIADGTLNIGLPLINLIPIPFAIYNSQVNIGVHRADFLVDISPLPIKFDIFLDGDVDSGYTIRVDSPLSDVSLIKPTTLNVTLLGASSVFANPTQRGFYNWTAEFHSSDEEVVTQTSRVNIR